MERIMIVGYRGRENGERRKKRKERRSIGRETSEIMN